MDSDFKIIKKVLSGDTEAFGDLFLKYYDFIFNAISGYVKFEDQAKDLTQQVFIKAIIKLNSFNNEAKFSSWLYSIARNLSMNYLSREKDKYTELNTDIIKTQDKLSDESNDRKEVLNQLYEVIQELSPHYREIVKLYYFEEKSYKEISETLNLPINTVKTHLLRARERIKKKINI